MFLESNGNYDVKITVILLLWRHKTISIFIMISDKHLNSPAVNIQEN